MTERIVLGKLFTEFDTLKDKLLCFVAQSKNDVDDYKEINKGLQAQVESNRLQIQEFQKEANQAKRSIKQINKLIGGK